MSKLSTLAFFFGLLMLAKSNKNLASLCKHAEYEPYWNKTLLDDELWLSPLAFNSESKYLTFEYDQAGWNNVRLVFENAVILAAAMGRTLVIPPTVNLNRMGRSGFEDYYNLGAIKHRTVRNRFFTIIMIILNSFRAYRLNLFPPVLYCLGADNLHA